MAEIDEFYLTDLAHTGGLLESSTGDLDVVTGLSNLKQALYHRLITIKGSLIHRPNYGVGIKLYRNAVGSISTHRRLALDIEEQFLQDFRVQSVLGVNIVQDTVNPGIFRVVVRIEAAGFGELTIPFTPFGEG